MEKSSTDVLDVLRSLATKHVTANGERVGFFMIEAARALGGLVSASDVLSMLMVDGLVGSESVVIGEDVHTLYTLTGVIGQTAH
jgi:hypothetical protein